MKKLKLGKPNKGAFVKRLKEEHEEEQRMQKLAEAAHVFQTEGEKGLREFLESQQEKKSDDEQEQM